MPNFLFWNLNGKNNDASIVRLTRLYDLDVLIFAELGRAPDRLLYALNQETGSGYELIEPFQCVRVRIYTRFSEEYVHLVSESKHFTIRRLALPGKDEIVLAAAHMPSKRHTNTESQASQIQVLADSIKAAEIEVEHRRTVLVGDLNVNPFEYGITAANGLHAVMSRVVARKESRTVDGKEYEYFYNPMWGHFGDLSESPPGTHYYWKAQHINYFWNMFDQVLIRPALLNALSAESVRIVTTDGNLSFLNEDGTPNADDVSDHLPIIFTLNY